MIAEQIPPHDDDENELRDQGYIKIEAAASQANKQLLDDVTSTKTWLKAYYFGTSFRHEEAYPLCAVGQTWPDDMRHPKNETYVMSFDKFNSAEELQLRQDFQTYVEQNRQLVALRAAEALGIDWQEIKDF
jgi:hypothetical protein